MLSITRPVGKGATNPKKNEVLLVQQLLNKHRLPPLRYIVEDGLNGRETSEAIEYFQRTIMKMPKPDSRVDPEGATLKALQGVKTGPVPLAKTKPTAAVGSFSANGVKLLKEYETKDGNPNLQPYDDQTGKVVTKWVEGATIGFGHLIKKSEWETYKNGITAQEAQTLFESDVAPFIDLVKTSITASLTQNQFDALVILAFNIGPDFQSSSVVKMINDPKAKTKYPDVESAWKAWNKSQKKVMKGLINRRQKEWDLYNQQPKVKDLPNGKMIV
jgi:lysozyme